MIILEYINKNVTVFLKKDVLWEKIQEKCFWSVHYSALV